MKIHHAVADGIAGVATMAAFLDPTPHPLAAPCPPWAPAPPPTAVELLVDNMREHASALRGAVAALARPTASARRALAGWRATRSLLAAPPTPPTSLDRDIGPDRSLALVRNDLEHVKRAAHDHGATVNDVLLTVTAGGLRALLCGRGEPVDGLAVPIYVPVTLRHGQYAQARGNLIGQMVIRLPVGIADPAERLRLIAADTAVEKAREHPDLGAVLGGRFARRTVLKILDRHPVSVTTADLPGPPQPLYLAGARLLEVFPVLPLIARVSVGVGALSYAGQFAILAIADRDTCPDLDVLAAGIREELRTLTASYRHVQITRM